jgi:hypothetical protein
VPQNFRSANGVIAGMLLGVVLVEGAQYSGSPITIFGREDFG